MKTDEILKRTNFLKSINHDNQFQNPYQQEKKRHSILHSVIESKISQLISTGMIKRWTKVAFRNHKEVYTKENKQTIHYISTVKKRKRLLPTIHG